MDTQDDEQQALLPTQHNDERQHLRSKARALLNSKRGHYAVLILVSLDVSSIFVEFVIQLFVCEGRLSKHEGAISQQILGITSLVFSCLFVLELLISIWAFGYEYFHSAFHCFDAAVILAGFVIDVILKGVLEEIGSIVIVLRLWRVFKIIEELSAGAEERVEPLEEELTDLKQQNERLQGQVSELRRRIAS